MSRCFQFPPPGYEKKARTDVVDLLKKEKHKEKKHKKEKKDKEKRESKDRKDRDKSDGKYREKKDRKKKSKEKKEKEREKDKNRTSTSQDRTISARVESCNGDKLSHKEREMGKDQSISSSEKTQSKQFHGHIREKPIDNSHFNEEYMDKFVLDLCQRIKDEDKGSASQSTERIPFPARTNHDWMVKNEIGAMSMEKEKKKDKGVDIRTINGQVVRSSATASVNSMVQNIGSKEKNETKGVYVGEGFISRAEEMPRTLENNVEPRNEVHKKESDDKQGNKRRDKDKEKKSHGKDKEREKEQRKEDKAKKRSEKKCADHDEVKGSRVKNGHIVNQNKKLPPPLPLARDGDPSSAVEGHLKKRKDIEVNGFLLENHVLPNKKLRPAPHPSIENGRKLEPSQTLVLQTTDRKVPPAILTKANSNEPKVNGMTEVQPSSISLEKLPSSSSSKTKPDQNAYVSAKPPHPDTKYLCEVLSVPKIDECCGFDVDDQEWLFGSKDQVSGTVGPIKALETPRVWAEALQIESADICALPYVVPF